MENIFIDCIDKNILLETFVNYLEKNLGFNNIVKNKRLLKAEYESTDLAPKYYKYYCSIFRARPESKYIFNSLLIISAYKLNSKYYLLNIDVNLMIDNNKQTQALGLISSESEISFYKGSFVSHINFYDKYLEKNIFSEKRYKTKSSHLIEIHDARQEVSIYNKLKELFNIAQFFNKKSEYTLKQLINFWIFMSHISL
jgi:hypothetical protein